MVPLTLSCHFLPLGDLPSRGRTFPAACYCREEPSTGVVGLEEHQIFRRTPHVTRTGYSTMAVFYTSVSPSQLQSRDFRFCIIDPMEFWKHFQPCETLPQGPNNPSRMVVHICRQRIRHGWVLMSKQNRFGLTVFLENCLVEEGLKSECCRFSDSLSVLTPDATLSSQSSFHLCVSHTRKPQFPGLMSLINQSGPKVYNGICSKMLTGSGKKVQVKQTSSIPSTTGV